MPGTQGQVMLCMQSKSSPLSSHPRKVICPTQPNEGKNCAPVSSKNCEGDEIFFAIHLKLKDLLLTYVKQTN